jgi:hypothetical protein
VLLEEHLPVGRYVIGTGVDAACDRLSPGKEDDVKTI